MADVDLSTLGSVIKTALEAESDTNTVTDAEKTVLGNTSGTNTGDEGAPEGTEVLSTGEAGGTKFLREDGDGTCSWQAIAGGGDALVANPLSQFAATTSLQLKNTISDETGSGALVFATSPTLVTPALGTPSALVGTNITGTAAGLTAGNATLAASVTTNANLTGPVTSVGNATAIADKALAIAKLADGTDGELITWGATGVIETIAAGTATHVLTSNGAGVAPTFQAAVGGGGGWDVDDDTDGNYAHGSTALDSLTTGARNVAIGKNAGTATNNSDCVLVGDNVGAQTTDARSVAIGSGALATGTAGGNAVAIGFEALNTAVDNSTAIGSGSVKAGASSAVGVGYLTLNVATGDANTALGYRAADGMTTASRCVFIGAYADGDSTTDDDQIKITNWTVSVPVINGYMGARTDVDYSGKKLTITGTSAYSAASTNQDGGDLELRPGQAASGGGSAGSIILTDLPTSDPSIAGAIYNSSGTLMISAG